MSQYVLLVFIHWIPLPKLWTTQAWTCVYMEVNHFDGINFKAKLESRRKWNRIMGFIQAYMPRLQFPEPDFSLQRWRTALNHFPARTAKGVDGIDVADLKHLPGNITSNLLDFLAKVNGAETPWPTQLLYGTVLSLAKQDQSHLPSHFRPVAILGTVYRT